MLRLPLKVCNRWVQTHRSVLQKVTLLLIVVLVVARQAGWVSTPAAVQLPLVAMGPMAGRARTLYRKFKFDTVMQWPEEYTLRGSLLTPSMGPLKGQELGSIDDLHFYDGDPRLVWSVYLDHAMNAVQSYQHEAANSAEHEQPPTLPFSWYDWADHHDFNKLIAASQDGGVEITCPFLYERAFEAEKLELIEKVAGSPLFSYQRVKYYDPEWYKKIRAERPGPEKVPETQCRRVNEAAAVKFNLPIQVHELHEDVRPEVYQMQARSYLFSELRNPLSLTMLESDRAAYRFPVRPTRSNLVESRMLEAFLSRHITRADEQADFTFDHVARMQEFLKSDAAFKAKVVIPDAHRTQEDESVIPLKPSDFEFDTRGKIKELEKLEADKKINAHQKQYLESLKVSIATHPALAPKYLSEAAHISQFAGMGYHRDKRFFNGGLVEEYQEYQARLNSLIRTWLRFTRANGLLTWVAHGSLYGYLYNAKNFPWDNDYDVQMPIRHLHLLSEYFNQSLVLEDPREGNGKFLVDVGTSITVRTNGNDQNNIDARFVDIDSGLYVDITGLSVSSNPQRDNFKDWYEQKKKTINMEQGMKEFKNPEVGDGLAAMDINTLAQYAKDHDSEFNKEQKEWIKKVAKSEKDNFEKKNAPQKGLTPPQRYFMNREVGAYNCRNNHFITMDFASPLVKTLYHGVEARVPYRVIEPLRKEYYVPKDLGFTTYQGNVYVPELRSWFNLNILKRFANMRSWNANLREVKSPINDLKLEDLDPLFENMHNIGYTDLFSLYYTSYNITAYRLKELEIQYDTTLTKEDKEDVLEILRHDVAPKMPPPVKDPTLYMYEKRLWEDLAQSMTKGEVDRVTQEVSYGIYKELFAAATDLYNKKASLFMITDDSGEPYDFNHIGTEIPKENKLFEKDYPDDRKK
ncbi:MNN4 (YKL201C) and YJR061W [Zygosaccharomyces parabailii]|nr:MNN4 (YKL201C) and YJR061W [Zygosaccharomyces parabailii]